MDRLALTSTSITLPKDYEWSSCCSFKTPAKGRSTQTNLVYDPTANELEQFKSLAELALGTQLLIKRQLSQIKSKISLPPSNLWPNERLLILYPGSSLNAQMRRWPIKNFKELAERYQGSRKIIIAGGPDETNLLDSNFPPHVGNYINQISLANWLSVFAHRDVIFVGNDGGLLHVAGVSGARTIGIFGPALGAKWAPRGQNQIFIQGTCPISPCIHTSEGVIPQTCQLSDHRCLNGVFADSVLGHIEAPNQSDIENQQTRHQLMEKKKSKDKQNQNLRVLVIKLGSLGDLLATTANLQNLTKYNDVTIDHLVAESGQKITENHKAPNKLISIPDVKPGNLFGNMRAAVFAAYAIFSGNYDKIILL